MSDKEAQPWWKSGYVWMVISGPAVVVVAGFVTLFIAIKSPNPMVNGDDYRQPATTRASEPSAQGGMAPAMQARNHAATGEVPALHAAPTRP